MGPVPYRHIERIKALAHWQEVGTPEAKAEWDAEEDKKDRHVQVMAILLIVGFCVGNSLLFYVFWNYGNKTPPSSQTNVDNVK